MCLKIKSGTMLRIAKKDIQVYKIIGNDDDIVSDTIIAGKVDSHPVKYLMRRIFAALKVNVE